MEKQIAFFEHYNYCKVCKKLLPKDYELDMCPQCIEQELFKEVREYIRQNDVTESDVAEHFSLPPRRVKSWIREGRIEYREEEGRQAIGSHCSRCGDIISGGSFCPKCMSILRHKKDKIGFAVNEQDRDLKMHYLDQQGKGPNGTR